MRRISDNKICIHYSEFDLEVCDYYESNSVKFIVLEKNNNIDIADKNHTIELILQDDNYHINYGPCSIELEKID